MFVHRRRRAGESRVSWIFYFGTSLGLSVSPSLSHSGRQVAIPKPFTFSSKLTLTRVTHCSPQCRVTTTRFFSFVIFVSFFFSTLLSAVSFVLFPLLLLLLLFVE